MRAIEMLFNNTAVSRGMNNRMVAAAAWVVEAVTLHRETRGAGHGGRKRRKRV